MSKELVKTWMTDEVVSVTPETTLPEAHGLMRRAKVRRLPVVKNGRLVGIVTLGDVREAEPSAATSLNIWELNYLLSKLTMKEIMTPNPITVRTDNTIGEAAKIMLENRIGGTPVVDEKGKLAGILTESDIFSMVVLHEWREEMTPTLAAA